MTTPTAETKVPKAILDINGLPCLIEGTVAIMPPNKVINAPC